MAPAAHPGAERAVAGADSTRLDPRASSGISTPARRCLPSARAPAGPPARTGSASAARATPRNTAVGPAGGVGSPGQRPDRRSRRTRTGGPWWPARTRCMICVSVADPRRRRARDSSPVYLSAAQHRRPTMRCPGASRRAERRSQQTVRCPAARAPATGQRRAPGPPGQPTRTGVTVAACEVQFQRVTKCPPRGIAHMRPASRSGHRVRRSRRSRHGEQPRSAVVGWPDNLGPHRGCRESQPSPP